MTNKERFIKAIARYQNFYSHKETKMRLLEKAFSEDSTIMDLDGLEELVDTISDMASVMFPNISEETVKNYIEYYIYEAVDIEEPFVEDEEKKWILNSSGDLYDMLEEWNQKKS